MNLSFKLFNKSFNKLFSIFYFVKNKIFPLIIMADPSLGVSIKKVSGGAHLTPTVNNEPDNATLTNVSVLLNDITNLTGFVETNLPHLNSDNTPVSEYVLIEPIVTPGKTYIVKLIYKYMDNSYGTITVIESQSSSLDIQSIPTGPGNISTSIRPGDQTVSINIGKIYTKDSDLDGYSDITSIKVYISKVGTDALIEETIAVDDYDVWRPITESLDNSETYEIAYKVINAIGESSLSQTSTFNPSDLPSEISSLAAFNNFDDIVSSKSQVTSSKLIFYWAKTDDHDELINNELPITSYTINRQEVARDEESDTYVNIGDPIVDVLSYDHNSPPDYELDQPVADGDNTYHYAKPYDLTSTEYGKVFVFSVFATNANGDGPESSTSNKVVSYISPSPQSFELEHGTEIVQTTGTAVTKHNGNLNLVVDGLSPLNGSKSNEVQITPLDENSNPIYEVDGATDFSISQVKFKLHVESNEANPALIYNGDVVLTQEYSTTVVDGNSIGTRSNRWRFNDIASLTDFDLLTLGTKYKFSLKRIGLDPLDDTERLSVEEDILRTQFKSPESVSDIQAYAINDDFTPVTVDGQPGIKVLFNQIDDISMNGCDAFGTPIEYELRSNSQSITGLSRIQHDFNNNATREFIIPSQLGNTNNLYIRAYVINPELNDLEIEGAESSPVVNERAVSYPLAVTGLITNTTKDTLTVSWIKQNLQGLSGFPSNDVINIVYLFNDTNPNEAPKTSDVSYTDAEQSATFTDLITGDIYKVYVVASGKYSKSDFDGSDKFLNVEVRQNYIASAETIVGVPGTPTNLEAYPGADKVTFHYDGPGTLEGHNPDSFVYNFILNSDNTNFPYQDEAQTLLQASVASVSGTSEAIIDKGYTSVESSDDRSNADSLQPGELYNYAVYPVASVGGVTIENTSDVLDDISGTALTLVSSASTPTRSIVGQVYVSPEQLYINNNVPKPVISGSAGQSSIIIIIDKPSDSVPNEMVIILDNNDAIGADGNPIPSFDTRNVRTALSAESGLFALENAADKSNIGGVNYGPGGYNFSVSSVNSVNKYSVTISNLVNGRQHSVSVQYAKTLNGYDYFSEATVLVIAAEAPPTEPLNGDFTVNSKTINLEWEEPANSGGAGLGNNGELSYEVIVKTSSGSVFTTDQVFDTVFTINSSNFANITDGTDYNIEVFAYYIKDGTKVRSSNALEFNSVRPNPAPESPTVSVTRDSNKLSVDITTAPPFTQSLYPLSSIEIYHKLSSALSYTADPITINGPFAGSNVLATQDITNLLNGASYDVKVVCVPNYTYAQAPGDVLNTDVTPFGAPKVTNFETVIGQPTVLKVTVELNGSGDVTQVVGLGKSDSSNAIGIINLSNTGVTGNTIVSGVQTGDISNYVRSGAETLLVAANQTATFFIDYGTTITGTVNHAMVVVITPHGNDAGALSTYFTTDVDTSV